MGDALILISARNEDGTTVEFEVDLGDMSRFYLENFIQHDVAEGLSFIDAEIEESEG